MDLLTLAQSKAFSRGDRKKLQRRLLVRDYRDAFPGLHGTPPTVAWTSPGGSSPIASATRIPWNSASVTVLGADLTKYPGFDFGVNDSNADWTPGLYSVEFDYYGSDLAVRFRNGVLNGAQAWTWVDGLPTTTTSDTLAAAASNNAAFYRLTFATVAQRRIRIYFRNMDFGGLDINATDSVGPTRKPALRVAVLGDSWWDSASGATSVAEGIGAIVERLLGVELCQCGQGGTGYITAGAANHAAYTDADRIAGVAGLNPDLVIVAGTSNDSAASPSTVGTAAASVYDQLHDELPGVPVVVIGPPMLLVYPPANRANSTAIKAAADAAHNVIGYLDQLDPRGVYDTTDAWEEDTDYAVGDLVTYNSLVREASYALNSGLSFAAANFVQTTWIVGNGKVGATNGSGNSDFMIANDGTHPSPDGHNFLGCMFAEWIVRLFGGVL